MQRFNAGRPPSCRFEARFILLALAGLTAVLIGCSGGQSGPPPPGPDFSLSVSPVSASAVLGNTTLPVTISVVPQNGFNGSVNINLQGVPPGVNPSPSSPFSIAAGASQSLTVSVLASAAVGTFRITVLASSGTISHSAQLLLTAEPIAMVRTFQSGSVLYLESSTATDTARIGLETQWGGSIVEVSLNGTNFVNMHDTGREVQAAQYDGNAQYDSCAGCTGVFGWDPVQGGDKYGHGSPVLAQILGSDSLYIKAQGYHWNPDDKGGGPNQPVLGDTYVEATVAAVTTHAFTFKVHFKVTHFGSDQHANSVQELPAVYVNVGTERFATYGGTAPWSNGPVTFTTMPQLPAMGQRLYASEQWGAFVDNNGMGLTVFVPEVAPYMGGFASAGDPGPTGNGTNYFAPFINYSFGANSVLESDIYLVAGDYKHARQAIYDLHNQIPVVDPFAPFGSVDTPQPNAQISGVVDVGGWALDNVAVSKVDVYLDGVLAGTAAYGGSRPDVAHDFPNAPAAIGYDFSLDSRHYANGSHTLEVKVEDTSGNVAVFPRVPVTVRN